MIFVNTKYKTNSLGEGRIVATGRGKQRTTPYNHALSIDANHGVAAAALLEVIASPEEVAKVRHPSGTQRMKVDRPESGKMRFYIGV